MRVEFTFTLEEFVDVAEKTFVQRPSHRKARLGNVVWSGAFGAFVGFVVTTSSLVARIASALIIGGCAALLEFAVGISRRRARIRRALREQAGGDGPFHCVIEIDASGLTVSQLETTTIRPWSALKDIVDTDIGVEITARDGGVTLVRSRAFDSTSTRNDFVTQARGFLLGQGALS